MNKTKWIYKENQIPKELRQLKIDKDILNILINRKINTFDKIQEFLQGTLSNIKNPFQMKNMENVIDRILNAIEKKENIWIYGDYDVDGITSTSISYIALKNLGAKVEYYIPLRDEGYGINKDALKEIKNKKGNLVISVDCGISSVEEALYAKEIGLDLIITDHHEITGKLPDAYGIINPKLEEQEYDFKYLAGVGTIFMVLLGIYEKLNKKEEVYKYLDIVAIGTIADIVPIIEQNRILVKEGLELLRNTENIGLKTLLPLLFEDYHNKEYNAYDIGFIIAPVFNAAGRLEDAKLAVELLTTPSPTVAKLIADKLIIQNNKRKDIQKNILDLVEKDIEEKNLIEKPIIISYNSDFHHGVIGIVASKIVDKYYKPTIILEIKHDEQIAVASCRSIEGFNILDSLVHTKDLLLKFGGHAGAAGFSISLNKLSEFEERINSFAQEILSEEDFFKPIKIDKEIIFNKVSFDFFNKLEGLKPFGFANPNPVFSIQNASIENLRLIGKDKSHLMLDLVEDNLSIKNCVWFANGHLFDKLQKVDKVDVAFKIKAELYKNKYYIKMYIEDIKESLRADSHLKKYISIYNTTFPLETVVYTNEFLELGSKLNVVFSKESVYLKKGNKVFGFLDDKLSYTLNILHNEYNMNFKGSIIKTNKTDSNYQNYILLERDFSFSTLAIKEGEIFKAIKNYIIGPFPYNEFQKKVLHSFFKEKKQTLICNAKHMGIKSIYITLALYYKIKGLNLLLVTDDNLNSDLLEENILISKKYIEGYDAYIFHNKDIPKEIIKPCLAYFHKDMDLETFNKIESKEVRRNNIIIIEDSELENNLDKCIYSNELPLSHRLNIYENIDNFKKIYATKDILYILN